MVNSFGQRFFILIEPYTTAFCMLHRTLSANLFCPSSAVNEDFSDAGYLPITSSKTLICWMWKPWYLLWSSARTSWYLPVFSLSFLPKFSNPWETAFNNGHRLCLLIDYYHILPVSLLNRCWHFSSRRVNWDIPEDLYVVRLR